MFRMFSLCFKTENLYLIFLAVRLIPLKYYKIYLSLKVEKKCHFCDSKFTWNGMHENARELLAV